MTRHYEQLLAILISSNICDDTIRRCVDVVRCHSNPEDRQPRIIFKMNFCDFAIEILNTIQTANNTWLFSK
ncbi:MAG: hypothetical protein ACI8XX_000814 [Polaribacter sp.]|jgi:hypothetical protein